MYQRQKSCSYNVPQVKNALENIFTTLIIKQTFKKSKSMNYWFHTCFLKYSFRLTWTLKKILLEVLKYLRHYQGQDYGDNKSGEQKSL